VRLAPRHLEHPEVLAQHGDGDVDEVIARGDSLAVLSMEMRVMALEDVFVTKLMALREHALRFEGVLRMARSLREQVDWEPVRRVSVVTPLRSAGREAG
jgi:hypothetical protein